MVITLKVGTKTFASRAKDGRALWLRLRSRLVMEGPSWWDLHPDVGGKGMEQPAETATITG
jgi:hypothetical protein